MALPRRVAALPGAIAQSDEDLAQAAPGHRFLLYLRHWQDGSFEPYKDAKLGKDLFGPQKNEEARRLAEGRDAVLRETHSLPAGCRDQLAALVARQRALIAACDEAGYSVAATATAPFATGLGHEHPTENGFAFLTPYGLPYLAGSGIKGVLRKAAEQLALENDTQAASGWTWANVWWLFGFEGASGALWTETGSDTSGPPMRAAFEHDIEALAAQPDMQALVARVAARSVPHGDGATAVEAAQTRDFLVRLLREPAFRESVHLRGALEFWDAFPQPAGHSMTVEIMTPHHAGYLQDGKVPHEAEQPNPVTFLALPAGSRFDFFVRCAPARLPAGLLAEQRWRALLDAAFLHAFDVLGFGAKTSVGYGAMQRLQAGTPAGTATGGSSGRVAVAGAGAGGASPAASISAAPAPNEHRWPAAQLTFNPGKGEITARLQGRATAGLRGEAAQALLQALGPERAARLRGKKELKSVDVRVLEHGNSITLLGLAEPQ